MKTTTQPNTASLSFKLLSILFILVLNASTLFAQTPAKKATHSSILIPVLHYQQKAKSAVTSTSGIYSVIAAKNFPIIESGDKVVLTAMDDSDNFNYEELFCSKTIHTAKGSAESTALALNYQVQKKTIALY